MTAAYDYYELAHPDEGVGSGFRYKTVPHVTLKSIANNPEIREGMTRAQIDAAIARYADQETLYDQPFVDRARARVSGPFTVEAVPAPTVRSLEEIEDDRVGQKPALSGAEGSPAGPVGAPAEAPGFQPGGAPAQVGAPAFQAGEKAAPYYGALAPADTSIARKGATLRHSEWRDELLKTGIRGKSGQMIHFSRVEPLAGTRWLHADAETKGAKPERVVVSFAPEHGPLDKRQVEDAWKEARTLAPTPSIIVFAAFQFDPEAAKDIDELTKEKTGMTFLTAQMNADLLTDDLKKKRSSNQSFWLIGRPDVDLRRAKAGAPANGGSTGRSPGLPARGSTGLQAGEKTTKKSGASAPELWEVEVLGFDYYNTRTGAIESGDTSKIAMWLLDTDYDGRSLYPQQVFFPLAADDEGWARLARNLKAEIDPELITAYRGTVSLPFAPGKRIAVKVIDDRGIESLKVIDVR
jgi:adenine-specific DNA-methyltransferase